MTTASAAPSLTALHVMPLLSGHEDDLAADAERLLAAGVCSHVACIMTLVPEGDPPEDKARILGARYQAFRRAFRGDPARLGILAQATIGHGYTPDEPAAFQRIIRPDGTPAYQMCPLDPGFRAHLAEAFGRLAALAPAFIMVDDDFRLLCGRDGCFCPLHLEQIGRRLGRTFDRGALREALKDEAVARAYDDCLLDSLLGLAGVIRDAVDTHDPRLPGMFCNAIDDIRHAGPLAARLAGTGQRPMVRINNARYLSAEMRTFPERMYEGAAQVTVLARDNTVLAETDTCPQNRYSTAAALLHAHYTGSILEGCQGAKHWLTRTRRHQPASGAAYRAILARNQGFYRTLAQAVGESVPSGYLAATFPEVPLFRPAGQRWLPDQTWAGLLGVLGLPCNFARWQQLPTLLAAPEVAHFTDDELRRLLDAGLLLDGRAAEILCRRGFATDLGVQVGPWRGERVSGERWGEVELGPASEYAELVPLGARTIIHSELIHRRSGVSTDTRTLGPAATLFINDRGGRVVVLAGCFGAQNRLSSFGFFDEDRKRELVELLGFVCAGPVEFHYPGDAEVHLKVRRYADGRHLLALTNLGHDPLDEVPMASAGAVAGSEMLTPQGDWRPVAWKGGRILAALPPAAPLVLRVSMPSVGRPC